MRKRVLVMVALLVGIHSLVFSQTSPADSIVIKVGESSKVIFAVHKEDIETLKYYDFQALMNDLITKLENNDSSDVTAPSSSYIKDYSNVVVAEEDNPVITYEWPKDANESSNRDYEDANDKSEWVTYENNNDQNRSISRDNRHYRDRRTTHSLNFDLGTNNLLNEGKFPDSNNDLYTVRPMGSWYVGLNSIQRTHLAGKFFLEWGIGISWYNFKFENDKTIITKDDTGITFTTDPRDLNFKKSKLTASYLNASFVPVIDFGDNRRKPMIFDNRRSKSFRLGVGPYVGYRVGSYTKLVYIENGNKKKDHNHNSFYIENIRYGTRLQIGFQDVDLFFNYDMNELFTSGKGPALNAFSFGVTF